MWAHGHDGNCAFVQRNADCNELSSRELSGTEHANPGVSVYRVDRTPTSPPSTLAPTTPAPTNGTTSSPTTAGPARACDSVCSGTYPYYGCSSDHVHVIADGAWCSGSHCHYNNPGGDWCCYAGDCTARSTTVPVTSEPSTPGPTSDPTIFEPTTSAPTAAGPTTSAPTSSVLTTSDPTVGPTAFRPTTSGPIPPEPTDLEPTTSESTTPGPVTSAPTSAPTFLNPTHTTPTQPSPTTESTAPTPATTANPTSPTAVPTDDNPDNDPGSSDVSSSSNDSGDDDGSDGTAIAIVVVILFLVMVVAVVFVRRGTPQKQEQQQPWQNGRRRNGTGTMTTGGSSATVVDNPTFAMGPSPYIESATGDGLNTYALATTIMGTGTGGQSPMYESAAAVGAAVAAPRGSVVYGSASDAGGVDAAPAAASAGPNAMYSTVNKAKSSTVTSIGSVFDGFADAGSDGDDDKNSSSNAAGVRSGTTAPAADYGFSNAAVDPNYASADSLVRIRAGSTGSGRVLTLDQSPAYYDAPATNIGNGNGGSAGLYTTVPELMDENIPAPRFIQSAAQFSTLPLWFHKASRAEAEAWIRTSATNDQSGAATATPKVRYLVRPAGSAGGSDQNQGANVISYFVGGKFWHKRFRADPATGTFRYTTTDQEIVALGASLHEAVPAMLNLLANETPRFSVSDLVAVEAVTDTEA